MSLATCWELPGLASVLAEVEEPRQYKVEALGDWAYAYGKSDYPQDFPEKIFSGNPLGHSTVFSDFWINIVKIMRPTVALGLTLNLF